jgi:Thiol-activated cytolysin
MARSSAWHVLVLAFALAVVAVACGGGDDDKKRNAMNAYLAGLGDLPTQDEVRAPVGPTKTTEELVADSTAPSGVVKYDCTSTPYTIAANPDKIVTLNPDAGKLWLGGFLQGSGYADGLGSLRALPIPHRKPLEIYLDLLDPDVTRTVDNPNGATVQSAIGDLVSRAEDQGVDVPTVAVFRQTRAFSVKEGLLSLGFSAKYLAAHASGNLSTSNKAGESTMVASLQQRYYTVSIVTPATPADYFTSDIKLRDFQEQEKLGRMGVSDPPVIVSNISYGRIFIMTVTARTSHEKLSAALNAGFSFAGSGGEIDVTTEQKKILREAKIEVIANGGNEADFLEAVRTQNVQGFLSRPSTITAARPISFQVDNLANGSAARFSETTNYVLTECDPRAGQTVTVGEVWRLSGITMRADKCNQDVFGSLLVNNHVILELPRDAPLKVPEFEWRAPDTLVWPAFQLPNAERYGVSASMFTEPGFYLAVFKRPEEGATTREFHLYGTLKTPGFLWFGDPTNVFDLHLASFTEGTSAEPGGSAHCPLTLGYDLHKVTDLKIPEP